MEAFPLQLVNPDGTVFQGNSYLKTVKIQTLISNMSCFQLLKNSLQLVYLENRLKINRKNFSCQFRCYYNFLKIQKVPLYTVLKLSLY